MKPTGLAPRAFATFLAITLTLPTPALRPPPASWRASGWPPAPTDSFRFGQNESKRWGLPWAAEEEKNLGSPALRVEATPENAGLEELSTALTDSPGVFDAVVDLDAWVERKKGQRSFGGKLEGGRSKDPREAFFALFGEPPPPVLLPDPWRQADLQGPLKDGYFPAWMRRLSEAEATRLHSILMDLKERSQHRGEGLGVLEQLGKREIEAFFLKSRHPLSSHEGGRKRVAQLIAFKPEDTLKRLGSWIPELDLFPEVRGNYIPGPSFLRMEERQRLLIPVLKRIVEDHFKEHPQPMGERVLLDIGAGSGVLTEALSPMFGKVIATEPDTGRFRKLQARATRKFELLQEDIREMVQDPAVSLQKADVVLMSHLFYFFLQFGEEEDLEYGVRDEQILNWAQAALKPGGISITVLNDLVPEPASRAHLRKEIAGSSDRNPVPGRYHDLLVQRGFPVQVIRPRLRFVSRTPEGLKAMRELLFFCLPGFARFSSGQIDEYLERFVQNNVGDGTSQFTYTLYLLVAHENPEALATPRPAAEVTASKVLAEPAATTPLPVPADEMERRARFLQWARENHGMKSTTYEELVHDLLLSYRGWIANLAQEVSRGLAPHLEGMDIEDMISVGTLGFIEALGNYDPARGVKLETYAQYRVKGAILDELRNIDPESREVRRLANDLKAKGREDWGVDQITSFYRVTTETVQRALVVARTGGTESLERTRYEKESGKTVLARDLLEDLAQQDPTLKLEQEDLIRSLTGWLSPKEKLVLFLYYHEDLTLKQIGQTMGYTESRISQLLMGIHQKLRERAQRFREGSFLMRLDSFPARARYARLANALSVQEVKRATGLSDPSDYEFGHSKHPQPGTLEKLAKAYRVSVEWLTSGKNPPEFLDARYLDQASREIKRVEEERRKRKVRVGRLAEAAGIAPAAYPFYLRGEVLPTPVVLEKIQGVLKSFPEYQRNPPKSDAQILAAIERLKGKRPTLAAITKKAGLHRGTVRDRKRKNPQVAAAIEAAQHPSSGLEEAFAILVTPRVSGMARVIPPNRRFRLLLWENQPIPDGAPGDAVVRLGPRPAIGMEEQNILQAALAREATQFRGQGMRRLVLVRWIGDFVPNFLTPTDVDLTVSSSGLEESIVLLSRYAGVPVGDVSEEAHEIRAYAGML